ncbi:MAG: PilW family protein [Lachnospirales bacterium]
MKKGLTLIEILVASGITLVLILIVSSFLSLNFTSLEGVTNTKLANDNLKNVETFIVNSISNAEELEILADVPTEFAPTYSYIYSKDSIVYYVAPGKTPVEMTVSDKEEFEVVFTKVMADTLKLNVNSLNISKRGKETEINLKNFAEDSEITGESTSHVITYISNLPEDEALITEFSFRVEDNANPKDWIQSKYIGVIDQSAQTIEVIVDQEAGIENLVPYVVHSGSELTYDVPMSDNGALNFTGIVNATVEGSTSSKTYTITVIKKFLPTLTRFDFNALDNNEWPGGNTSLDATSKIAADQTRNLKGRILENTREVMVSIDSLEASNKKLIPDFDIQGEYITIEGVEGTYRPGDKVAVDFNPGRTFSKLEYATSTKDTEIKVFDNSYNVVGVYKNEYTHLEPTILTVYATAADGVTMRSRTYEVYVSPYGYGIELERKRSSEVTGETYFSAWIDQRNLLVYMPAVGSGHNNRFFAKYYGDRSLLKKGTTAGESYYRFRKKDGSGNYDWYASDGTEWVENTGNDRGNAIGEWIDYFNVYNTKVYDKVYDGRYVGIDDKHEMDKLYGTAFQDAGMFKFHYENTLIQNRYLYKKKVSAEIIQPSTGYTSGYIGNGNESQMGQINLTFPANEYLKDMVASMTYMGEKVGAYYGNKSTSEQKSEITENDIGPDGDDIKEYYVKSQVNNKNHRYKFNVNISDPPTFSLNNINLIDKGRGESRKLSVRAGHTYTAGINRPEEENGLEYKWYYVPEYRKDRVGTDQGMLLSCTSDVFKVDDYKYDFLGKGYVYAAVRSKSETYTVSDNGEVFGGVYTNWVYTKSKEVNYGVELKIKPEFRVLGMNRNPNEVSVDIAHSYLGVDRYYTLWSNARIKTMLYESEKPGYVNIHSANYWMDKEEGNNLLLTERYTHFYGAYRWNEDALGYGLKLNKSIGVVALFGELYDVGDGDLDIDLSKGLVNGSKSNVKQWISGKNVNFRGGYITQPDTSGVFGVRSVNGGTVNWDITADAFYAGSKKEPIIIYQPDGGTINITANLYGFDWNDINLFIYAPKSNVNINSVNFCPRASVIGGKVTILYDRIKKLDEFYLPQ